MMLLKVIFTTCLICCATAQRQYLRNVEANDEEEEYVPPPQYERRPQRNSDIFNPASVHYVNIGEKLEGDYKFGYDTGKRDNGQSFREETRLPDGTVRGAYGYVDETGTQRIVRYTAGKDGYKVEGDPASDRVHAQSPPPPSRYSQPPQPVHRPPPQPVQRAAPQQAYLPPAPIQRAPPQQSYIPAPSQGYAPLERQPMLRNRPAPEPELRHDYPDRSVRPSSRQSNRGRQESGDYDYEEYDNNELPPRNVPVDTSLFNYNIGLNQRS